jgi:D-alanyl-D-alanine carboxypeptidase
MGIRLTATLTALGLFIGAGTAVAADRNVVQEAFDQIASSPGTLGVQARVKDDRQRFTVRSGFAEINTKKPAPHNGSFRAGSITKTFVSTVVLQLVGEGKVELDAPVERYLPGLLPH